MNLVDSSNYTLNLAVPLMANAVNNTTSQELACIDVWTFSKELTHELSIVIV
ncbi:hypothetical protein [Paenibacillus sp. BC26]|uniref:hypothetical protein n=1 Tax=Paenibacillus sp. BC26 TaxID=1881032 RepID=UPI0015A55833|nr:hypothetical protein [Paenibacillus sp. BC26]